LKELLNVASVKIIDDKKKGNEIEVIATNANLTRCERC
jgi:hypothetical protein